MGPSGFTGFIGPIGFPGNIGQTGGTGVQGVLGQRGVQGPPGGQGPKGVQGLKGLYTAVCIEPYIGPKQNEKIKSSLIKQAVHTLILILMKLDFTLF